MKSIYLAAAILGLDTDKRGWQVKFAKMLNITPVSLNQWLSDDKKVKTQPSPKNAKEIERLTGGQIKREWLRPDIFG